MPYVVSRILTSTQTQVGTSLPYHNKDGTKYTWVEEGK